MVRVVPDAQQSRVLVERPIQQRHVAAEAFGIVPKVCCSQRLDTAAVDHLRKRSFRIVKIVEREELSFSEQETDDLKLIGRVTEATPHLVLLAVPEVAWCSKDDFRQMCDRQQRAVDDLAGVLGWCWFRLRRNGSTDSLLVVCLDLPQDGHAVGVRLRVDDLVVIAAEQNEVRMPVSVVIRQQRIAPRSLPTVGDDVSDFGKDRSAVVGGARLDEALATTRKRTHVPRMGKQDFDFGKRNVSGQGSLPQ